MKAVNLIFSNGIRRIPHLEQFFPNEQLKFTRFGYAPKADRVLGWGNRPSTQRAKAFATKHQLPYVALEDGFLRSVGLGVAGCAPYAMVYDDVGIYYDTRRPSRLEQLILQTNFPANARAEAEKAMQLIVENQLSKYNHAPALARPMPAEMVLVIDQTFGDMAVKDGQASEADFAKMLNAALTENPNAEIWVKTHPDVISGKKKGYLTHLNQPNIHLFAEDCNPISLLEKAQKIYCVTSQMGFEALLLNKHVVVFGLPWFAGWGLTDDRHENIAQLHQANRREIRALWQCFYAAYFEYSRYLNPNTGMAGTIFDVIDYLTKMKRLNELLRGDLYCVGMSLWKRAVIKPFFNLPSCRLHFVKNTSQIQAGKNAQKFPRLLVWGNGKSAVLDFAKQHNMPILRMEDGFIRSVGLGSNLVAPLSIVVDDLGIYFNAQSPSRLEHILQNQVFSEADLAEAAYLKQALITHHIGKYNVGAGEFDLSAIEKKKILVVGQVEDDASIQTGSPKIFKNLDLLKRVRELNPHAYIVYKPHPDVVSGNRVGQISPEETAQFADNVAAHANVLDCIAQVDELHTMTSLAGFEALLRGKQVHCYGLPFYAGWGLTNDHLPLARRTRKLTLLQLIAGTLVYYPFYLDPEKRELINAKQAIAILQKQREIKSATIQRAWVFKQLEKLKHLFKSLTA